MDLQQPNDRHAADHLAVREYTPESAMLHPSTLFSGLIADLYRGRELAWRIFVRDIQSQFRQTYLGYLWAFLPPLFTSLTFIFLQSQGIVRVEGVGKSYAAFAMIGTLLWQTFAEALQSPLQAIMSAKSMLSKINFPREAILVAGLYTVGFNFLIRLVLIALILLFWGIVPGVGLLTLPIWTIGLIFLGFAIGLTLVPIGGLYGDVLKSLPILTQFWMLLTPVVYPARTSGWAGWLSRWNPVAPLITSARASLTGEPMEGWLFALTVTLLSCLVAILGLICFRVIMPRIIERMGG
ncbi:MAG: ABC transporter permease [Pirellulaceae bacterium]|jgi:lipopolysaccharide transport system permease protein